MKKTRDVAVAFIELIPERPQFALLDIAARERGLPRAGGSGDPQSAMCPRSVDPGEKVRAREHVPRTRRGDLGEAWTALLRLLHSPPH